MKLADFLKKKRWSKRSFATLSGLSPPVVNNVIQGKDVRMSTCLIIEKFTDKEVTFYDMAKELKKFKT